jgi:hypothetical protein
VLLQPDDHQENEELNHVKLGNHIFNRGIGCSSTGIQRYRWYRGVDGSYAIRGFPGFVPGFADRWPTGSNLDSSAFLSETVRSSESSFFNKHVDWRNNAASFAIL